MPRISVTLTVVSSSTVHDSGPLLLEGLSNFAGSGEQKVMSAASVSFSAEAEATGGGRIVTEVEDNIASDLYRAVLPLADDDARLGYPLLAYTRGLGAILQPLADLVDAPEKLVTPELTPADWLPWLGQFVGAGIPENGSGNEAADRNAIKNSPRLRRGTVTAILEEVATQLEPEIPTILFNERGVSDSAWHGQITVLTEELKPGVDQASLQTLVNSVKPSITIIDVAISSGLDYDALLSTHTTYAQLLTVFGSYAEMARNPRKQA